LLVLFIVIIPFIPNIPWTFLVLHVTTVFTLVVHWYMNNDACFLTLLETKLRGVDKVESFMHSIVSPVYKIEDNELKSLVSNITPLLGIVSLIRIYKNWDVISQDLLSCNSIRHV